MSYRSIVLDLHEVENVESLVRFASALGTGKPVHLTGVHRVPTVDIQYRIAPLIPAELLRNLNEEHLQHATQIQQAFTDVSRAEKLNFSWHLHTGKSMTDVSDAVAEALTADLVVTSQASHASMPWLQRGLMEKSECPVVVVPEQQASAAMGEIAIAWSGATHTARAVRDAMPLLERADGVRVIRIGPEARADAHASSGSDVVTWLERHGCRVVLEANDPEREHEGGTSLAEFAHNLGVDMMVSGGYGHSRFYDNLIGGMTDDIIAHSRIPVFLSH